MARKLEVVITGDAAQLERTFRGIGKQASGFERGLTQASKGAAIGLLALGVGAKRASDEASNLNESINAVNVVFGKAAPQIHAFAKVAAEEAGLSMRQLNQLVTPVGAALQNVGLSADQAAKSSIELARRAADMASVFNVDVSEALAAIQAGLRGEADPLERFGVGLSDAAVTAKALEMGLADTRAEIDANDKAQARLALIMQQSNKVAGDFKNTSDQLANSQRINTAEAENQRAKLGTGLLPVMQSYQSVVRAVTGVLGSHTTATTVLIGVAGGLAVAVLAITGAVKVYTTAIVAARAAQIALNFALAANPIGLVIVAVAALGVALVVAYKKSETFRTVVHRAFEIAKIAAIALAGPLAIIVFNLDRIVAAAHAAAAAIRSIPSPNVHLPFSGGRSAEDVFPGRAAGGAVTAGRTYMVGERGRELFTPSQSGRIIPNNRLGAGGGPTYLVLPDGKVLAELVRVEDRRYASANGGA